MPERIYVTGMGICSPIGNSLDEVIDAFRQGRSGIKPITSFDATPLTMKHAGEVPDVPIADDVSRDLFRTWDKGTRMAVHAAGQAIKDASLDVETIAPERIGVCSGTSGSGQYQNARFNLDRSFPLDPTLVFYLSRNSPHFQSSQVAAQFGIRGPNLAIGAATAGGGIAIATALSWLRTSRVDMVLVGGSESFSLLNVIGFDQLGLSLPEPCTPFSGKPGMTFGEGAGYLVLETESSVARRGVRCWAEIRGAAIRADGFDPILFDPCGDGQRRAMQTALANSNANPEDIDWIRASGTGGRDQDLAETQAIKSAFPTPPPVSSLEPYLGHANGAGPAIGLVAAILCMREGLIPATLGCTEPRPGCDLDYVSDASRTMPIRNVLCNTAAFGGVNSAIIAGLPSDPSNVRVIASDSDATETQSSAMDEIVISGIGMVSAIGCGTHELANSFYESTQGFTKDDRLQGTELADHNLGLVQGFDPRKHCPLVKLRGLESLTQYAAGAVALALKDAKLDKNVYQLERVGVVSAITRSSGVVFERLFTELQINGFRPSVGRLMLRNGRFMIASQLANWFGFKGYSSTISLGIGSGLHGLIAAYDQLRHDPTLDAMVVVTSDELSPFTLRTMHLTGLLRQSEQEWRLYDPASSGFICGEGAVAMVLERKSFSSARNGQSLAKISGAGSTFDGLPGASRVDVDAPCAWESIDTDAEMARRSLQIACTHADIATTDIDLLMGNGTGVSRWDAKERLAAEKFFPELPLQACVNGHLGMCEASGPLFNVAAAIAAMKSGRVPLSPKIASTSEADVLAAAPPDALRSIRRAMIVASTEHGHNASIVLDKP